MDAVRPVHLVRNGPETWARPEVDTRDTIVSDLFLLHHRRLVGLASLLVDDRQAAEEVVQDAFANLYRSWKKLRDPDAAVAFLNRSVVNAGRDSLRRRQRATRAVRGLVPRPDRLESAEQTAVHHQESHELWAAVVALPARQREVLVLRYYLDQSEAEIAETLGITRGSVKKHASRGVAALARTWRDES
jgi:RNA polymerase sigma-70 factor (sigma-E family)